jgi:hypothetical protein
MAVILYWWISKRRIIAWVAGINNAALREGLLYSESVNL